MNFKDMMMDALERRVEPEVIPLAIIDDNPDLKHLLDKTNEITEKIKEHTDHEIEKLQGSANRQAKNVANELLRYCHNKYGTSMDAELAVRDGVLFAVKDNV